jgi:RsiW-degrading membrane proteinase PrsW (M82 family)
MMRPWLFYARRTLAVLLVIFALWFAAGLVYYEWTDPLGGGVLIVLLAILCGFVFLIVMLARILGSIVRSVAGSPRRPRSHRLGADYEALVTAKPHRLKHR